MAKLAGTFVPSQAKGNREELSNVITFVDQHKVPLQSSLGKGKKLKSTNPERTARPAIAAKVNRHAVGDEYVFDASTPSVRTGNRTHILRETWSYSKTQEAVDNAGKGETINRRKIEAGIQIKKDLELALVSNLGSVGGDTPRMGGLPSFLQTNVSRGAGGGNGGFNQSTGLTEAATGGTARAFTKDLMDDLLEQCFNNGADVTEVHCSPFVKRTFSKFMKHEDVADSRVILKKHEKPYIRGAVEMYMGDFHTVTFVPNPVMATDAETASNVLFIDPSKADVRWLRPIHNDENAEKLGTGDATKGVMIGEGTLEMHDERAHGVIADVFGRQQDVV